ncbi:heme NO-binding domain-containing protein [Thalassotalea sp. LPB0316]|uniref:heme NO-binding domain-containing protein n=1 Tax=Thalassotalea sp. LPB0316 TaxID=2769490 RepID=UPI0018687500|nr:heme NO-binding domain-containing protein [Thalassotalea sp. LPB0316]QOL25427.1 heme NO-binding domain-containing protein [Thalassotalea sp. LPB0316]
MKGAIFTGLAEFVETHYTLTDWLEAIDSCDLPSNGEYIATEIYDDSEFFQLAGALSKQLNVPGEDIYRAFGEYFFTTLMAIALKHVEHITDLFDFIHAVDSIIHIEVQKADPLAYTPTLLYDQPNDNTLVVRYMSKRKMCHFAEGLILGAAKHFNQPVELCQSDCMLAGDDHCLIKIQMK